MDVITTHKNADFDALAAAVAARRLHPKAVISFPGSLEKAVREYLATLPSPPEFRRARTIDLKKIRRLIVVDTRQAARIGVFAACLGRPGTSVFLYDHHPGSGGGIRGDYEEIRAVGATATLFCQIFQERGIAPDAFEASLLYLAIHEDTGSFTFESTTAADLEAAAWLIGHGADPAGPARYLSREMDSRQVRLLNKLLQAVTAYTINNVKVNVARIELHEYVDEFAVIVRRLMDMENLDNLFALARMGERLYLIARSRVAEVNAGRIATEFGGGGHAEAASASVRDMTMIEAEERLLSLLARHVRLPGRARELMSAPPISTRPEKTIKLANRIIDRYNITVLPVVDENDHMVGMISRRMTGKALYHGLGDRPVSEYMSTDFAAVSPEAELAEIQDIIVHRRQRFLPVVENGRLVGVITRTDLLNLLLDENSLRSRLIPDRDAEADQEGKDRNLTPMLVELHDRGFIVLLRRVGEIAQKEGCRAFAVGGFVRDLLLRRRNLDLDVVVEGDGLDFARKLAEELGGGVREHEKFKTAVVKLPDGTKVDVATARLEYYERPAAMPTVEKSSIKLDLYRRDFTINAMAIHLNPDRFGVLVDFFNCMGDLRDRKIRVLHNLSFVEDPTRIFRAVRFEQRLGFTIGSHTQRLIKSAVRLDLFASLATPRSEEEKKRRSRMGFRFFGELKHILSEDDPVRAIGRLAGFDLLRFIHPALELDPRLRQILDDTTQALNWHHLLYQNETVRRWFVFLLALTSRLTIRQVDQFSRSFAMPEKYRKTLLATRRESGRIMRSLARRIPEKPSAIHRLLAPLDIEGLLFLMGFARKQEAKKAISMHVAYLRQAKSSLNGNDLKEMGYPPGPVYRRILDRLLAERLDGNLASREDEIAFLKRHYPVAKYRRQETDGTPRCGAGRQK